MSCHIQLAENLRRKRHVEIDFLVINRAAIPALPAILARLLPGSRAANMLR